MKITEVTFRMLEVLRATKTQPRVTKHSKTKQLRAGACAAACAGACAGVGAWDPSAEEADVGESRVQGKAGLHNKILSKIK